MLSQRGMAGVGKPSTRWSERGVTGGRRVSLTAEPGFYGYRQSNFGGADAVNLRLWNHLPLGTTGVRSAASKVLLCYGYSLALVPPDRGFFVIGRLPSLCYG